MTLAPKMPPKSTYSRHYITIPPARNNFSLPTKFITGPSPTQPRSRLNPPIPRQNPPTTNKPQ